MATANGSLPEEHMGSGWVTTADGFLQLPTWSRGTGLSAWPHCLPGPPTRPKPPPFFSYQHSTCSAPVATATHTSTALPPLPFPGG